MPKRKKAVVPTLDRRLSVLPRKELQTLAKMYNVPANKKTVQIVKELFALKVNPEVLTSVTPERSIRSRLKKERNILTPYILRSQCKLGRQACIPTEEETRSETC